MISAHTRWVYRAGFIGSALGPRLAQLSVQGEWSVRQVVSDLDLVVSSQALTSLFMLNVCICTCIEGRNAVIADEVVMRVMSRMMSETAG